MNRSFLFAILASLIRGFAPAFEKIGLNGRIGAIVTVDPKSALLVAAGGLIAGLLG